jgi:hypothetical protein
MTKRLKKETKADQLGAGAHATDQWYFLRYSDRNGLICNRFFIYWLTLQIGYIDRPVDWLQYALKIRADTKFLIKLW